MGVIVENAWAKINLTLHVTGKRDDGYHVLDSLVVFAISSDEIRVSAAAELSLAIEGPMARSLCQNDENNLVLQAARVLADFAAQKKHSVSGANIVLKKCLPVAAGIGGGSADAAATLRALNDLWSLNLDQAELEAIGATLGADVPVCIGERSKRIRGIGTKLEIIPRLPMFHLVMVNPNVAVSTPAIFNALENPNNTPMESLPTGLKTDDWLSWLQTTRNDLCAPAVSLHPIIADVMSALESAGARFVRMSGSGATCFGIFDSCDQAQSAAISIFNAHPNWWVDAAETL